MTFQEIINSDKPTVVDFFATWCGPCQMYAPILQQLKDRVQENATIVKIDIDKNPAVAAQYNVQSVPTTIIFKNGEVRWKQSGVRPVHELERLVNENL